MMSTRPLPKLVPALCAALVACSSSPVPVDAPRDPVSILSFDADPDRIEAGQTALLAWKTRDARKVLLEDGAGAALGGGELEIESGELEVSPSRTTRYVLTAVGATGARRQTELVIEVKDPTTTAELRPEKERIGFGGSTRLVWTAAGATSVQLLAGDEVVLEDAEAEGSFEVTPERTTQYTLRATGPGGVVTATAKVEVAPVIESFRATPSGPQLAGAKVTLLWKTAGADTLALKGPKEPPTIPPELMGSGAVQVDAGIGKVELVATRDGVEESSEVELPLLGAPTIEAFAVTPGHVTAGPGASAQVLVSWKVSEATELVLERDDGKDPTSLDAEGTLQVQVTGTTVFLLRATNGAGEQKREAVVHATAPATIESFRASESHVGKDDPFELSWSTTNAILVDLLADGVPVTGEPVAASGRITLRAKKATRYRLAAFNAAGTETVRDLEVTVGAPIVDSFAPAFDPAAPGESVPFSWKVRGATSAHVTGPDSSACTGPASEAFPAGACEGMAPGTTGLHTFTLHARNGSDTTTATQEIRVTDGPIIRRFEASAALASAGEALELSWLVLDDADGQTPEVSIEGDDGSSFDSLPAEGTLPLDITAMGIHSFTLRATTSGKAEETRTVTVEIVERPVVTLEADPPEFDPSKTRKVMLRWTTSNAVSVDLHVVDQDGDPVMPPIRSITDPARVAAGDHDTSDFDGDVTFRVVARNAAGTTAQAEVLVTAVLPSLQSFEASEETVAAGDTVVLSWVTADGVVSLTPEVEITSTASLIDLVADGGTPLPLAGCGTTRPLDEGCADIAFPAGFDFPFFESTRTGARVFANGFLGFALSAQPGATATPALLPASSHDFVHFAPFWSDLAFSAGGQTGLWRKDRTVGDRRGVFLQWRGAHDPNLLDSLGLVSSFDFQLVLWESGDVDFRYGRMEAGIDPRLHQNHQDRADGRGVTIGWQNLNGTIGRTMNGGAAVPGGLSNRAWRLVRGAPPAGSIEATVHETTTFELCVTRSFRNVCRSLTVTVD
ncbi:MAG TPA: hypothetical protein VGD74_08005 [Vulgatibacter sp.]